MEFCEGGDLKKLIKKCSRDCDYIAEDVIWKVFTQIVLALAECHNRKAGWIIHRDIKPGNVFLDGHLNVKIGDFGLSRIMGRESLFAYTHVGTPYYMSPEQIDDDKYTEKSDIWSTGCLLFEMSSLHPPFQGTNQINLALKIREGKFERVPSRYSEEL
jgi:serine/threonine protein kinase